MTNSGTAPWLKYRTRQLEITRKTPPPIEDWTSEMMTAEGRRGEDPFWRADLLLAGTFWYGEDKALAIFDPAKWSETSIKTWQNNLSVGRRIPPAWYNKMALGIDAPTRRRDNPVYSTYSHHAEVAYLEDPNDQDYYLQKAIDNQLSVTKLRDMIKYEKEHGLGSADDEEDVAFKKRTVIERIGSVHTKLGNLLGDLPEGWDPERELLSDALHLIDEARNSANNRAIGEPALLPEREAA